MQENQQGKKDAEYLSVVKKWQERNITTAADLETALDNFKIVFAYHSGTIENAEITYHNTKEIFDKG